MFSVYIVDAVTDLELSLNDCGYFTPAMHIPALAAR
jgi:hypothetical protein